MQKPHNEQNGFTLIELMMAMAIFSFMLIIISSGFIGIMRIKAASIASADTQQNARLIVETLQRQLRTNSQVAIAKTDDYYSRICLFSPTNGYVQYEVINRDTPGEEKLVRRVVSGVGSVGECLAVATGPQTILNDEGIRVLRFVPVVNNKIVSFDLTVAGSYTKNDQINQTTRKSCLAGTGSEYCSVTTLSSSTQLRGGSF